MDIFYFETEKKVEVKKVGGNRHKNPKILRSLSRARIIVDCNGSECFDWILTVIENSNWNMCPESYVKEVIMMLKNFYTENIDNLPNMENVLISCVLNSVTPADLITMAKYSYSEFPMQSALNLCLKELTKASRVQ